MRLNQVGPPEVKFNNGFITVLEQQFKSGDNTFSRIGIKKKHSVAALVYDREFNELILVSQYRYPADMVTVELVAGHIEQGESPYTAICREIQEELGYKPAFLETISNGLYLTPGLCNEYMTLFFAEVYSSDKVATGGGVAEEGESISEFRISKDELKSDNAMYYVGLDMKTWAALNWFKNRNNMDFTNGIQNHFE